MSKKIVSLFDKKDDDRDQDHGHGQAFYAGGSEHSGQQILGPDRDNLIQSLLHHASQHAEANQTPSNQTLPITLWRNGFTVGDDNELRDYASNRQFIDCLKRGEVPPELASRVRGGMIDVKLDNKAFQDFKPEQKSQVFSGEGRRLGAPTPTVVGNQDQQQPEGSGSGATPAASSDEKKLSVDEMRLKRLARFSQKPKQ